MLYQSLAILGLAILGAVIYYGPDWLGVKKSIITLGGVDYEISRDGDLKVIVKFNLDGVDFTYCKDFPEMALRDDWVQRFGPLAVSLIMYEITGDMVFRGIPIPKLEDGKALVISGRQGSGKGILAQTIIDTHGGSYYYCRPQDLIPPCFTPPERDIWVVEEFVNTQKVVSYLKQLVSSEWITYHQKGQYKYNGKVPKLIILVTPEEAEVFKNSRRFNVVEI